MSRFKKYLHRLYLSFFHEASTVEFLLFTVTIFGALSLLLLGLTQIVTHLWSEPSTTSVIRFGTYNIWNFNPIWEVRRLRIAELIDENQFDVLALQEGILSCYSVDVCHSYSST